MNYPALTEQHLAHARHALTLSHLPIDVRLHLAQSHLGRAAKSNRLAEIERILEASSHSAPIPRKWAKRPR